MAFESGLADGSPAAALAVVAPRLGLAIDPIALRERFFLHDSPQSLKALVEIAEELGLEARAFRGEVGGLRGTPLPAVVHFRDPERDEPGFAVLVEIGPDRYVVEEGAPSVEHVLSGREFERLWTGVVVTFMARRAVTPPRLRRGRGLHRIRHWLRGGDLASPASETALRLTLVGGALLASTGAIRFGIARGGFLASSLAVSALALALLGLAASRALYFVGRRSFVPSAMPRLASVICKRGSRADCEGVLSSRYASVLGIDLSSLGLAFFASTLMLMAVSGALPGATSAPVYAWLGCVHLAALPGSLWLVAVQVWPLRRVCPLCMACHVSILASAALGAVHLFGPGRTELAVGALVSFALLHAVAFGAGLGLVVPFVGLGMEVRSHRTRLGWIGATPWGALAEMIARPRAASRLPETTFAVGIVGAPFRLDALVHPLCSGCGPVVDKIERLVTKHPDRVRACFHLAPRDLLSLADLDMCAAVYAAAELGGGARGLSFFRAIKEKPREWLRTAGEGADALLRRFLDDPEAKATERSHASVRAADALYAEVQRGTPTVLLNGKPWESSVEELDLLLGRYPDLLATLLRVTTRAVTPASGASSSD